MITISQLTELLGWASVINVGYLFLATVILMFIRGTVSSIHSKMFDIDEKELGSKYFDFLSNYKIVTLVFMVAPYIALKIMGQ
jgi:cytochrome c biogenesis factor